MPQLIEAKHQTLYQLIQIEAQRGRGPGTHVSQVLVGNTAVQVHDAKTVQ